MVRIMQTEVQIHDRVGQVRSQRLSKCQTWSTITPKPTSSRNPCKFQPADLHWSLAPHANYLQAYALQCSWLAWCHAQTKLRPCNGCLARGLRPTFHGDHIIGSLRPSSWNIWPAPASPRPARPSPQAPGPPAMALHHRSPPCPATAQLSK